MKLKELITINGTREVTAQAANMKLLRRYNNEDCVVAYLKEQLGIIVIIRGDKKYFAFVWNTPKIYYGAYNYKFHRIEVKLGLELMNDKIIVVDEELFGKLKKYLILEAL